MTQLNDFYNDGFGWICRACESQLNARNETAKHSRLMREGEAESKNPRFSNSALAKWADAEHQILVCPRCKTEEKVFTTETRRRREIE